MSSEPSEASEVSTGSEYRGMEVTAMMNTTTTLGTLGMALLAAGILPTASQVDAEIPVSGPYQPSEVTAMETTTETTTAETTATEIAEAKPAKAPRAKKPKKDPKTYPFMTKAQIAADIAGSLAFACEVLTILHDRQTKHEQDTKSTLNKNARGFMSSHAVHGSRIAELLKGGVAPSALSDEDRGRVMEIAPRYTKQMAEHFRAQAIAENPELANQASCFFSGQ